MKQQTNFEQMGKAALIPGMQYMLDMMQKQLDEFRAALNGVSKIKERKPNTYWQSMTPEERSAEISRRHKVTLAKSHPRNPDHPDHEKWLEKMRKGGKARWAKMTPTQKKSHLKAMNDGKKRKAA